MLKRFMQCATLLLFASLASCCLAGPPFNVDDPGTAELRHFNLYATYLSSQVKGSEAQALPSISLAYGLRNNVELDLGLGIASTRVSGAGRMAGFGDMTSGFKWRFQEESRCCPQCAFCYALKIPTADAARGLGTGAVDHSAWLTAAKSFGRTSLFTNVGYNFLGGTAGQNNLFYGAGLTFQATEQLILGAQVYGNTANAPGSKSELAWGVGMTYNFAPDRSFLLQMGRSEQGFSDLNVYAGLALTFK